MGSEPPTLGLMSVASVLNTYVLCSSLHFCSNQPCRSIRMLWPLLLKTRWSSQRSVQLHEGLSPQFPGPNPPLCQLPATSATPNFSSLTATQPSVVYVVGVVTVSCGFYFCCSASSWVPPEWHCWADAEHDETTTPRAGHMHGEGGWSWESFTIGVLRVSWRFGWVYITTFMC